MSTCLPPCALVPFVAVSARTRERHIRPRAWALTAVGRLPTYLPASMRPLAVRRRERPYPRAPVPANVIFARAHERSLLSAACLPVFLRSLSHRERTGTKYDVVSRTWPEPERKRQGVCTAM